MPTSKALSNIIQTLIPEARAEQLAVPGTGISLYLINADYPQHALANEVAQQLMERPLYWAFCWASGAVMARYLLQHPSVVNNKTVIDFGSGSGVVAIAAAKAGAKQVIACDNDPNALLAIKENAQLNSVSVELIGDFNQLQSSFDVLTAADVLYDRENLPWLDVFGRHAQDILIADSRIKNFQHPQYAKIGQYESCTLPDLDESPEFRLVSVYSNDIRHQLGS